MRNLASNFVQRLSRANIQPAVKIAGIGLLHQAHGLRLTTGARAQRALRGGVDQRVVRGTAADQEGELAGELVVAERYRVGVRVGPERRRVQELG